MKRGLVYKKGTLAGVVWEDDNQYGFLYSDSYINKPLYGPVSRTLPVRMDAFTSTTMLPFFDGLIPEGWLLEIAIDNWKLDRRDRMGLLLMLCGDCIGDISIVNENR